MGCQKKLMREANKQWFNGRGNLKGFFSDQKCWDHVTQSADKTNFSGSN